MKIVRVGPGLATISQPEFRGNLVTDGIVHYFYDTSSVFWTVPDGLFDFVVATIEKGAGGLTTLEVSKEPVSITDLMALNTTFTTDEIIKLNDNALL